MLRPRIPVSESHITQLPSVCRSRKISNAQRKERQQKRDRKELVERLLAEHEDRKQAEMLYFDRYALLFVNYLYNVRCALLFVNFLCVR